MSPIVTKRERERERDQEAHTSSLSGKLFPVGGWMFRCVCVCVCVCVASYSSCHMGSLYVHAASSLSGCHLSLSLSLSLYLFIYLPSATIIFFAFVSPPAHFCHHPHPNSSLICLHVCIAFSSCSFFLSASFGFTHTENHSSTTVRFVAPKANTSSSSLTP